MESEEVILSPGLQLIVKEDQFYTLNNHNYKNLLLLNKSVNILVANYLIVAN